jgi:uncharacterized protein YbaR (Trm112 family)
MREKADTAALKEFDETAALQCRSCGLASPIEEFDDEGEIVCPACGVWGMAMPMRPRRAPPNKKTKPVTARRRK